jgi:signal transduction histidine kinase
VLDKAASFHKNLISDRDGLDTAYLEEENRRLRIELAIARKQECAAQQRAAHLARANAALQKTIDALGNITGIEDFIPLALKIVLENFQAVSCAFFEHADGDLIYLRYWLIEGQVLTPPEILALDPDKYALIIRLAGGFTAPDEYLGTHHKHRIHAVSLDHAAGTCVPEFDHFCCACGWESELNVPCVIGNVAEGALVIYRGAGLPYSECEIALAETLSAQLALALQASRLAEEAKQAAIARAQEQAAQKRAAMLEQVNFVLQRSTERLSAATDPKAIIVESLRTAAEVLAPLGVKGIGLVLYQPETRTVRVKVLIVDGVEQPIAGSDLDGDWSADNPLMAIPWRRIQSEDFIWGLTSDTSVLIAEVRQYHESLGSRSIAYIPLRRGEETTGWIGFNLASEIPPTAQQIEILQALTSQVSLAAEMERLAEIAREAAISREQEKAAEERAMDLARVNAILSDSISGLQQAEPEVFLAQVVGEIIHQLRATNAMVVRIDADQQQAQLHLFHDGQNPRWGMSRAELPLFEAPFSTDVTPAFKIALATSIPAGQRSRMGTAFVASRYDGSLPIESFALPGGLEWMDSIGASDAAFILLFAGERVIGSLHLHFTQGRQLQPEDDALLIALSRQAAIALRLSDLATQSRLAAIAREQQQSALERAAELATINHQLQQHTQEVQRGYSILEATAQATNALLTIPDFDQAVNTTLQILGEALETDRVKILEWIFDLSAQPAVDYFTMSYEWVRAGTIPQLTHPSSSQISIHGAEAFMEDLIQNDGFGGLLHEWPQVFWEPFAAVQAQGIYCVPIRVERQLWGVLVYDDCQTSRERNRSELTVLKIAADCIGSAFQRQRTQQALLQSEQARSGELAKANHALRRAIAHLTTADSLQLFLNAVLKEAFQTSSGVNGAAVFDYEPAFHTVQLLALVISGEVINIASDPRAEVYRSPIPSEAAGDWHIPDPERRIVWIDIDDPVLLNTPEAVLWHKQQGHQRLNVIPLFSGEQPLGFLGLAFTTRTPPSDAQIEHWWALAQHVGLALRLANLAEEAKQTAILDERNRMARDIHDTLAQSFTGIIMQLEALKSSPTMAPEETQAHFNRIRNIARLGLSEARRSVHALRPVALETASFPDALRHLLNQMTQGTPVQTTLHIEGMAQSLPASVEENLLRIAQEAVTNAIRHGQAQTIALQLLSEPAAVHLQILDDGQGFAPATHFASGFGLIGMQERVHHLGGHLHLVSQPGQGTEITVTIPSKG